MLPTRPPRAHLAGALLLLLLVTGPPWRGGAQEAPASYQGPVLPDPTLQALQVEPVWRDKLDSPTAIVAEGAAIYLRDGRLVATELATGWQNWSYGAGLEGPLAHAGDLVLVAEGDGTVTALAAATGTREWSADTVTSAGVYFAVAGDAVLVANAAGAVVLDLASGELRLRLEADGGLVPVHFGPTLTVMRSTQGEPQQTSFLGFDPSSGELRWRVAGVRALLEVGEEHARFFAPRGVGSTEEGALFMVTTVDLQTGEQQEEWEYRFDTPTPAGVNRVFVADGSVWAVSPDEREVHRFPEGGAAAPSATYRGLLGGEFRVGPLQGFLLFESEEGSLYATREGSPLLTPHLPVGARLSRLDVVRGRLYAGRVDGTFLAVDVATARPRYLLSTDGHGFGPTLSAGPFVVVQGDAEIFVVEDLR